jgi:hypothetical protein
LGFVGKRRNLDRALPRRIARIRLLVELNALADAQRRKAVGDDPAAMEKEITPRRAVVAGDEAEALLAQAGDATCSHAGAPIE